MNLSRYAIFALFLFLFSCGRKELWQYREVVEGCAQFNSANLTYCPSNLFTGIEVQFLKGEFGTLCFLNVFSRAIPPFAQDPKSALVIIEIDDQQYPFKAIRMESAQRVLLPDEAASMLISALHNSCMVTIYLESYMAQISSQKFPHYFEKLQKLPL